MVSTDRSSNNKNYKKKGEGKENLCKVLFFFFLEQKINKADVNLNILCTKQLVLHSFTTSRCITNQTKNNLCISFNSAYLLHRILSTNNIKKKDEN